GRRLPVHRVFGLQRDHDPTGVSGTGHVADGAEWPDGTVTIRWRGERPSTVNWTSLDDAMAIHGHGGATRIIWADEPPTHRCACGIDWPDPSLGCGHTYARCESVEGAGLFDPNAIIAPDSKIARCNRAVLEALGAPGEHDAHDWTPQPGMSTWCPGTPSRTDSPDSPVDSQDNQQDNQDTQPGHDPLTSADTVRTQQDTGLRDECEAEIRTALEEHRGQHVLMSDGEWSYVLRGAEELAPIVADAAMRVRDRRIEQLAAGRQTWKTKALEMERERDRSDEAARRILDQRQELAAERYAWQERALQAEATVARVRAECDAIARDVHGKSPVALAGFREANARIRVALDDPAAVPHPAEECARELQHEADKLAERLVRARLDAGDQCDRAEQAEAAVARVRDLAARWSNALGPDRRYAEALHTALDTPAVEPHPAEAERDQAYRERPCGDDRAAHGAHRYMLGRRVYQCPGAMPDTAGAAEQAEAEAERDQAYAERAALLAWLAALHPANAVITPAADVDEPGWRLLYLLVGGWQMSWHIHPRDAALFDTVEHVQPDDPRAQWDGHTTDQKYERIQEHVARLGEQRASTSAAR
ncbi:hypothetical protein ACWDTP_38320, partial [Mycobacterium sp. NPDC003449]